MINRFTRAGAALVVLMSPLMSTATAFAQGAPQAPPNCDNEKFRAFDFWLGTWDVMTPDGKKAGVNTITSEENGCLLVERWRGAGGSTGQSYNYLDPATGKWRQIWVSQAFTIDYAGGIDEDGAMALEGEIAYRPSGQTAPFRGKWTLNPDGTLEQAFHQYNPKTEKWAPWFTGLYRKTQASAEAAD